MILRALCCLFALLFPAFALAADEPKLTSKTLYLPAAAKKVLLALKPGFVAAKPENFDAGYISGYSYNSHQAPFAVIGDFNADRIKDVVVLGYTKKEDAIIALLSKGKKYNATLISSACRGGVADSAKFWSKLTYAPPGKYNNPVGSSTFSLKNDGFVSACEEKGSSLYYYDKRHAGFAEIINGD